MAMADWGISLYWRRLERANGLSPFTREVEKRGGIARVLCYCADFSIKE